MSISPFHSIIYYSILRTEHTFTVGDVFLDIGILYKECDEFKESMFWKSWNLFLDSIHMFAFIVSYGFHCSAFPFFKRIFFDGLSSVRFSYLKKMNFLTCYRSITKLYVSEKK